MKSKSITLCVSAVLISLSINAHAGSRSKEKNNSRTLSSSSPEIYCSEDTKEGQRDLLRSALNGFEKDITKFVGKRYMDSDLITFLNDSKQILSTQLDGQDWDCVTLTKRVKGLASTLRVIRSFNASVAEQEQSRSDITIDSGIDVNHPDLNPTLNNKTPLDEGPSSGALIQGSSNDDLGIKKREPMPHRSTR